VRRFVAAMLCTLLVSCAGGEPQTPASVPGVATTGPSRPAETTPRPKSLVAALRGRLAVLGSLDGIATDIPGQFTDVSSIAVTADGRSLIVSNGPADCEAQQYQPQIDRVVIETGARDRIVGGAEFPAVNAKGIVAYGGVCDGLSLGFTDLVTGQNFRNDPLGALASGGSPTVEYSVRPLSWLTDGRTLFYEVSVSGEAHPRYYFGLVWPLVLQDEQLRRRVAAAPHEAGQPTAAALVNDKTVALAYANSAGARVREWDVTTENFGTDRGFQGFLLPETIKAMTVDPSGTHFLVVTRSGVLYRWSVGDTAPNKLADGVSAAAWLP
jgi:hypothetical protein